MTVACVSCTQQMVIHDQQKQEVRPVMHDDVLHLQQGNLPSQLSIVLLLSK